MTTRKIFILIASLIFLVSSIAPLYLISPKFLSNQWEETNCQKDARLDGCGYYSSSRQIGWPFEYIKVKNRVTGNPIQAYSPADYRYIHEFKIYGLLLQISTVIASTFVISSIIKAYINKKK